MVLLEGSKEPGLTQVQQLTAPCRGQDPHGSTDHKRPSGAKKNLPEVIQTNTRQSQDLQNSYLENFIDSRQTLFNLTDCHPEMF